MRFALKVQIVLQAFTAFGHCVPNPEVFFIAPISAMLMFMFIASVVDATHVTVTGKKDGKTWIDRLHNVTRFLEKVYRREGQGLTIYHEFFTFGVCMVVTILFSHIMVAILGMLPFFLMFAYTKNIFTNLTTVSRVILVLLFVVDVLILFGETYSCHWLLQINEAVPWHAPFDLMFWQVTASAIDVMIILPGTTIFKKASPGSMDHVKTGAKTEGEGVTSRKRSASSMSRRWSLSGLASLKKEDGKDD